MARFSVQIPSLTGGVSQQAPQLRLVGQAESMVNCYPSLLDGLTRRHPIDHVATLDDMDGDVVYPSRDYAVHIINRDPDERYLVLFDTAVATVKQVQVYELSDGTPVPVYGPAGAAPDFSYLEHPTEPANRAIKAVTIADYTLVLNRMVETALSAVNTGADPSDNEGFLFVRAGNYDTRYTAYLTQGDTEYVVSVTTWDGVGLSSGTAESWTLTIVTTGLVGGVWSVTILGNTATHTVTGGDTPTSVAASLRASIGALANVSTGGAGTVITITADLPGVHFIPAVSAPGTYSLVQTTVGFGSTNLASIDTADIAQALLDLILALPGTPFTAERIGAIVRIESADPFTRIRTEEGRAGTDLIKIHRSIEGIDQLPLVGVDGFTIKIDGGTGGTADDSYATFVLNASPVQDEWDLTIQSTGAVGGVWKLRVLGQPTTYTVLAGDTPTSVAAGIAAAVAALPDVGATSAGPVVTMTADEAGPLLTPSVEAPHGGGGAGVFTLEQTSVALGNFGAGTWVEGRGFNIPVGLDVDTMPHRLIRRQDDDAGTVTGTPLAKWFEWSPNEWIERAVGDQESAPDPSFTGSNRTDVPLIGSPISDMFFFRNRLGFTSGQRIVMSEVSRFFNLYRTTVLTLPDSDPIDITVPSTAVVRVHHAVPLERRLILFADDTQFVLEGDPVLTPQSVQISATTAYLSDSTTDPLADTDGVFFAASRGLFSGVRRFFATGQVENGFASEDTTIAVPQYIPGRIIQMAAVEPEGLLIVLSEDDRSALYCYKTFQSGDQRLQTAWFRYDLGGAAQPAIIQGFGVIGNTLHLVVHRDVAAFLERSLIQSDSVDPGADYLTHLDRRLQFDVGTYSNINGRTSWTVPYRRSLGEDYFMVVRSTTGVDGGDVYPLEIDSLTLQTTTFSAQGNHAAEPVWIGQGFESRYEFSKLYLKNDAPAGGQALRTGGRLQMLHGSVVYEKTASLAVEVTPVHRTTRSNMAFEGMAVSAALLGELTLPKKEFRFPVMSNDALIAIVAAGPLPMAVQSAQFECDWAQRMSLYRGQ